MRVLFVLSILLSLLSSGVKADIDYGDRVRIREADRIAAQFGNDLWPGWGDAPFAVLLVTPDSEYLVNHPRPSADFSSVGFDSLIGSDVWSRRRVFDKKLLATFPAVSGVPTVVIGQPRNTEASRSTRWVATLLHEHFHQWQQSHPRYYSGVESLGLARGDTTGMWMLDYPFPYDAAEVNEAFAAMCSCLTEAVGAIGRGGADGKLDEYLAAKRRFKEMLHPDDYAYFSFQLWQEGIARYTEIAMMKRAGAAYAPTVEYKSLPDYTAFGEDAAETLDHLLGELSRVSLKTAKRRAFYHVGAAEAVLLDAANPDWRARYLTEMFSTDSYFGGGGD